MDAQTRSNEFSVLHPWPEFREAVRDMAASQRSIFLRESALKLDKPDIFQSILKKAALVTVGEMLPYKKQGTADHIINEWYRGEPDLDMEYERKQLRAGVAIVLHVLKDCHDFSSLESACEKYFRTNSRSHQSSLKELSGSEISSPAFDNLAFAGGKHIKDELPHDSPVDIDDSLIAYAERAARIFVEVARYKCAEEYCFERKIIPQPRNVHAMGMH